MPEPKPKAPKSGQPQEAPWKTNRRPDGSMSYDFGKGPIDQKTLDHLCERVKREYKGHPLDIKASKLKELLEACGEDSSAFALQGAGRGEPNYFEPFSSKAPKLPKSFDDFVPGSVKQEGDHILEVAQKVGYPIDAYNVGKTGEYADLLREGANKIVYHQYADIPEHGEELVRRLGKLGINIPYDVVPVATTVAWKEGWQKDPGITVEKVGNQTYGRSMQYAIAFSPTETSEAKKLIDFFKRNADHKKKDSIRHSWKTPDIRASFVEPVDEFDQVILNRKSTDTGYDLMFLNRDPIDGYQASTLWVNKELGKFAKSLSVYWIAPVRMPMIFSLAKKAVPLTKLVYRNGFLVPKLPQPKLPTFGVLLKSKFGFIKPEHRYLMREGAPGHYKYDYGKEPQQKQPQPVEETPEQKKQREVQRVMKEEQARGARRTPLQSEEAREQTHKRLREMRDLLKQNDWGAISRVLTAYGISQDSQEWKIAREAFEEHQKRGPSS